MSEPAPPPYIVHDYCAVCGERLQPAPLGGRYACHPNEAMYWSEAIPSAADELGSERLTGRRVRMQTNWINDEGRVVQHRPLFLYRSPA